MQGTREGSDGERPDKLYTTHTAPELCVLPNASSCKGVILPGKAVQTMLVSVRQELRWAYADERALG